MRLTRVRYRFDYALSPAEVVDLFRDSYGPANRAFASLAESERPALHGALVDLWSGANESRDPRRTIVDAEYLEVVARRTSSVSA